LLDAQAQEVRFVAIVGHAERVSEPLRSLSCLAGDPLVMSKQAGSGFVLRRHDTLLEVKLLERGRPASGKRQAGRALLGQTGLDWIKRR
jgi:hypothetical protein